MVKALYNSLEDRGGAVCGAELAPGGGARKQASIYTLGPTPEARSIIQKRSCVMGGCSRDKNSRNNPFTLLLALQMIQKIFEYGNGTEKQNTVPVLDC